MLLVFDTAPSTRVDSTYTATKGYSVMFIEIFCKIDNPILAF